MEASWIVFLILFIILIISSGLLMALLISKLVRRLSSSKGSWQELAQNFPVPPGEISGEKFTRQIVAVGPVIYKNCVTVVISPQGLNLSTWIKKQGLFLPWDQIKKTGEKNLYWRKHPVLSIGNPEQGTITIPENLFAHMSAYLKR